MRGIFSLISKNAFLRNSIILFSGTMVANVLNYIFHLVIGRMVDSSTYGEVESLISLLTIVSVPAGALALIATKYAANMKASRDTAGTLSLSKYLHKKILQYGIPLFLVAILFTPLVKQFLNIEVSMPVIFLWGAMFLSFLGAVTSGILSGWQRFADTSIAGILSTTLKLCAVVLFLKIGFGVSGVIGSYALSFLFTYLITLFFVKRLLSVDDQREKEETIIPLSSLKSYVLPAFYGTFSLAILGNVDMIFAKHHLAASVSGEYGALSIVAKTIFFVTGVLTTVLFAMSAGEKKSTDRAGRTFQLALWSTAIVAFGSVIFFSLFPQFIVSLLFGEKYLHVSHLLGWFALAAAFFSLANLFLQYLLSLHETRVTIVILALAGLEVGTLFFYGSSFYAIIGITIVTQVVATLIGFVFVLKKKGHVEEDIYSAPSL